MDNAGLEQSMFFPVLITKHKDLLSLLLAATVSQEVNMSQQRVMSQIPSPIIRFKYSNIRLKYSNIRPSNIYSYS